MNIRLKLASSRIALPLVALAVLTLAALILLPLIARAQSTNVTLTVARSSSGTSDTATASWTPYGIPDFSHYQLVACEEAHYSGASCSQTIYKSGAIFDAGFTGPLTVPGIANNTGYGFILQVWRTGGAGALKFHAKLEANPTPTPIPTSTPTPTPTPIPTSTPTPGPTATPTPIPIPVLTAKRSQDATSATIGWSPYGGEDFQYYRVIVCDDSQFGGSYCNGTVFQSEAIYDSENTGPLKVTGLDAGTGYNAILQVWRDGGALKIYAAIPPPALEPTATPTPEPTATPTPDPAATATPTATPTPEPIYAPAAPTNLTATADDASVTLSWDDPSDSSITGYEYNVNHNATGTGNFTGWSDWIAIAGSDADTTSYKITGLTNGREYRYHLRAVNTHGAGSVAPNAHPWFVSAKPQGTPDAPESVSVDRGDGTLTASWPGVASAESYRVAYTSDNGASWRVAARKHTETSITISSVNNKTEYLVGVQSQNAQGQSERTNSPLVRIRYAAPPAKPVWTWLTRGNGVLVAHWPPVLYAYDYDVRYKEAGGNWTEFATGLEDPPISISVDNKKTYVISVRARNNAGYSKWNDSYALGPYTPRLPKVPEGLQADAGRICIANPCDKKDADGNLVNIKSVILLRWYKASADKPYVSGYEYQFTRKVNGQFQDWSAWQKPAHFRTIKNTHYSLVGLNKPDLPIVNGSEYRLRLRAVNDDGPSPSAPHWSPGYVSALPLESLGSPPIPAPPAWRTSGWQDITILRRDGNMAVSWPAASRADGYQVRTSTDGGKTWTLAVWNNVTTVTTIYGVSNTATYIVSVRATNDYGESPWKQSDPSLPETLTVDNLSGATHSQRCEINSNTGTKCAVAFTTGGAASGYTLAGVVLGFGDTTNFPGLLRDIRVTLRDDNSGVPASATLATLSGANPVSAGNYVYACSAGSNNNCALQPNTTYFIHADVASGLGFGRYQWLTTQWDGQNLVPSGNGWSIADELDYYNGSSWTTASRIPKLKIYAPANPTVSVSNLAEAGTSPSVITSNQRWSAEFATGPNPAGYTLLSATTRLNLGAGSPNITWKIHTSTTNASNQVVPSDTVQATLTAGTATNTYSNVSHTCAGSGCDLSPNTTYFLLATAAGNAQYFWNYTDSTSETVDPPGNGWSIGNGWYSIYSSNAWGAWATYDDVGKFSVTAKPK